MRRVHFGIAVAILLVLPLIAGAQGTKIAKGKATAVSGNSVTVSVDGKDMVFAVDAKTQIVARGGSTATREAKKEGAAGASVDALIKTGENVEVTYSEMGGKMQATMIRAVASAGAGGVTAADAPSADTKTARGDVTAVTGTSLSIKGADGEMMFSIDAKTVIEGTGVGTAGKKITEAGGKPAATDFVGVGDTVAVRYTASGATKSASNVRVLSKAAKK